MLLTFLRTFDKRRKPEVAQKFEEYVMNLIKEINFNNYCHKSNEIEVVHWRGC